MSDLLALPGDPTALASYGKRYLTIADAITDTTLRLNTFASDVAGAGEAVTALSERSSSAAARLARAQPRYGATAQAISVYAVSLRDAHDAASSAIERADAAAAELPYYENLRSDLSNRLYGPQTGTEFEQVSAQLRQAQSHVDELDAGVADARAAYDRAVNYRDEAARLAIAAIEPALEAMNDTLRDQVNSWVESLPGGESLLGQWLTDVLSGVLEPLQTLVIAVVELTIWVNTVVSLFWEIMSNLPPEKTLLQALLPGVVLAHAAGLSALLAIRLSNEERRPTPAMVRLPPQDQQPARDYEDLMTRNAKLDGEGQADSTVVEIVEVLDEHGNRLGWRVLLPSTQDWQEANGVFEGAWKPQGDQGAMNDLDSNLSLMLAPSQQAAYERAVTQAMMDAGVLPGDPVMLSGWSQGGILAGKMAADPLSPFSIQAVFTSGSPIDLMDIPESVSVISVQHKGDPVPKLDSPWSGGTQRPHWVTVSTDAPIDPATGNPVFAHSSSAYTGSADAMVDSSSDPRVLAQKQEQAMFFSEYERVFIYEGSE
ncbi:hypothetical protein ESZ53_05160 [Salinibacterium sp. UTAS2018]|uniref:hypothetical protein n=1 Tax=Salinibacterium sp. UTAS2018 TaxID=2508880 RepID=UPI0010096498|nr:hypothetical protein [Salinibacterium sp. UTAS2018]QAV69876.1 hypothetical protein ESZ53_05160 [Salinibacterium sp. UTAS2018]